MTVGDISKKPVTSQESETELKWQFTHLLLICFSYLSWGFGLVGTTLVYIYQFFTVDTDINSLRSQHTEFVQLNYPNPNILLAPNNDYLACQRLSFHLKTRKVRSHYKKLYLKHGRSPKLLLAILRPKISENELGRHLKPLTHPWTHSLLQRGGVRTGSCAKLPDELQCRLMMNGHTRISTTSLKNTCLRMCWNQKQWSLNGSESHLAMIGLIQSHNRMQNSGIDPSSIWKKRYMRKVHELQWAMMCVLNKWE